MQQQARISNIQKFSVDDGPGIRTTVFFKGCNLQCAWCHNPECISPEPSLQFVAESCATCGKCAAVCPSDVHEITADGVHLLNRSKCTACGACEKVCPAKAVQANGKLYTPEEVVAVIRQDREFYADSGGGATFSGGEPLLQHDFLEQVLRLCKEEGYSTAVDTAGNVPFAWFEQVMPYADLFLYDVKALTPEIHRKYTGVDNALILENIRELSGRKARLIVRTPVIPGVNDTREELEKIADFLTEIQPELVQLLPYHSYGIGKYRAYEIEERLGLQEPPSDEFMNDSLKMFQEKGLHASF